MSVSGSSDEFSYQTRLVVYNFLGLVPATPTSDEDELENSQNEQLLGDRPRSSWNDALETLPTMSLIDRLSESEAQQMKMKNLCDEVTNTVKRVEPTLSGSPPKQTDESIERDQRCRKKTSDAFDLEVARQAVLNELKQEVSTRCMSPNYSNNEETVSAPITIIQKRKGLKILGDAITASDEATICRRLSLQPFNTSSTKLSNAPLGRASAHSQPHSASVGGLGSRPFFSRKPSPLLSSSGLTSSREILTQIDEDHELNITSETLPEDGVLVAKSSQQDILLPAAPIQNFPSRSSLVFTPPSVERQSSSISGCSRRCSTYVDITEVDVENLVKAKALPPSTLPLKRELSIAFEQLERTHKAGNVDYKDDDDVDMVNATSPESEVADSLRALGDRIQEEYGPQLNVLVRDLLNGASSQSFNYNTLQNATSQLLQETQNGWTRVTLLMLLGQHLIYELLRHGFSGISSMAEFTAMLVEDHAADFIVNNGGWNSISDIGVVETEALLSPLDVDSRLLLGFNSPPVDADSSLTRHTNGELAHVQALDRSLVTETHDCIDSKLQNSPYPESNNVSVARCVEFVSPDVNSSPVMTSTPSGATLLGHQNYEGEILLLRQNSQQYVDEMESARRAVAFTHGGALAGIVLMAVLTSWIVYRRINRST